MKKGDYIIGVLLCLVGVFVFFQASQIPTMVAVEKSSVVNARFFPQLMSVLLVIMGILLLIENYSLERRNKKNEISANNSDVATKIDEKNKFISSHILLIRLSGVVILCFIFLLTYNPMGFLLSSVMFIFIYLLIVRIRDLLTLALVSLLPPVCIYLTFKMLLGVPLPEGILGI